MITGLIHLEAVMISRPVERLENILDLFFSHADAWIFDRNNKEKTSLTSNYLWAYFNDSFLLEFDSIWEEIEYYLL